MQYREFAPADILKPYVKCFYTIEHEQHGIVNDRAFAMGCMEFMFNLSEGVFETGRGAQYAKTPRAELWGQIIRPLNYRSLGKNKLLGVRFYSHTAALFLNEPISVFNDGVSDIIDVAGKDATELHEKLYHSHDVPGQLQLLEAFLIKRLNNIQHKRDKFGLINDVIYHFRHEDFCENMEDVASRYGISARYLQKLFLQYTGLSPKLYQRVSRFQKSLALTASRTQSLTSIAHECGYFDQSHFIRDFKFFTEIMPSAFDPRSSSAVLITS